MFKWLVSSKDSSLKKRNLFNSVLLASVLSAMLLPLNAQESVTLIRHSNKAAEYYNSGDWGRAKDEYRTCIGLAPNSIEYYDGLYNTCKNSNEWDQVAFALDKIFALDPKRKDQMAYEYGQALFHMNHYDEAITWLKKALAQSDAGLPVFIPTLKKLDIAIANPAPPPPIKSPEAVLQTHDQLMKSYMPHEPEKPVLTFRQSFENAIQSECICLAEYDGYEKSPEIAWNHPACARFKIYDIPKGPPLTRSLPVKYEFHDSVNTKMPAGWKFSEDKMPQKGSKWILFIENAVPKRSYGNMMFELFEGSYGRQPVTEENMNHLDSLLDKYNMRNTHS